MSKEKLDLIKKAVKSNIHIVKSQTLPLCGGVSETSKETPTCIFIITAKKMDIPREQIMEYLKIDENLYEELRKHYIKVSEHWKFKQKENLVNNYIKYHG